MLKHGRQFGATGSKKNTHRKRTKSQSKSSKADSGSSHHGGILVPPNAFGLVEPGIYRSALFDATNFSFIKTLHLKTCIFLSFESLPRPVANFLDERRVSVFHLAPSGDSLELLPSQNSSVTSAVGTDRQWSLFSDTWDATGMSVFNLESINGSGNKHDLDQKQSPGVDGHFLKQSHGAPVFDSLESYFDDVNINFKPANDSFQAPLTPALCSNAPNIARGTNAKWRPLSEEATKESLDVLLNPSCLPCLVCCAGGIQETGALIGCLRRLQNWNLTSIISDYRSYAGAKSKFLTEQLIELFDTDLVTIPTRPLPNWFQNNISL